MQHGHWYLATPYALYPHGKQAAYEAALEQTAYLLSSGIPVYYKMLPFGDISLLPSLPRNLDTVLRDSSKWADRTFPLSTSYSRAAHLLREAKELQVNPEDPSEIADILLLTAHLAMGERGPEIDLSAAADRKLSINKDRKWGQPDNEGVVEHLRFTGE